MIVDLVALVFALVFASIAAFWSPNPPAPSRLHFGWIAVAFFIIFELHNLIGKFVH